VSEEDAQIFARYVMEYGKEDEDNMVEVDLKCEEEHDILIELMQDFMGDARPFNK